MRLPAMIPTLGHLPEPRYLPEPDPAGQTLPQPEAYTALSDAPEQKTILQEVGPFFLVVIGVPVLLLIFTPRRKGESMILRRRGYARRQR